MNRGFFFDVSYMLSYAISRHTYVKILFIVYCKFKFSWKSWKYFVVATTFHPSLLVRIHQSLLNFALVSSLFLRRKSVSHHPNSQKCEDMWKHFNFFSCCLNYVQVKLVCLFIIYIFI